MRFGAVLMIGLMLMGAGPAGAGAQGGAQGLGPALDLARTARFEVEGPNGPLAVVVSWPEGPPPAAGYGIIYAIDAGWTFGTLREAARLQGGAQAAGAVGPTVIVGIGWPGPDLIDLERRGPDLIDPAGAAATRDLIAQAILPRVEAVLPVDPAHRMLLGHSYGGAFALTAGFARPDLFSHVAAGSPSLWTDPSAFAALRPETGPRVFLGIGALERPEAAAVAGEAPERVARLAARDMAGRAEALARQLGVALHEFPGQGHGGSVAPFLAAALTFLWQGSW
ncbi:alpha/beta hydrolase [Rhodobacter maris]|uniref:Esterase n=1 Tax=Rhodobacter maris TaxID=446682 RepID=A0A285STN7_9RHOB|nr:alpha/beta hydrolase-fold protein [Rhodobacter maris]SOC11616.1 hypothetical protein SAMN05877831_10920 [Rhodobacter maris]